MKKIVEHKDGSQETVNATPVCGEDFCDTCGACLACQFEDKCIGNNSDSHLWVEYETR